MSELPGSLPSGQEQLFRHRQAELRAAPAATSRPSATAPGAVGSRRARTNALICRSGRVGTVALPGQPGALSHAVRAGICLVPEAMSCRVMRASCQSPKTCSIVD